MKQMKKTVIAALAGTLAVAACTSDPYTGAPTVSNTLGGAAIGAAAGAGLGMLAGGDDRRNALIGAGIGALAGGLIGSTMDQAEAELRAQLRSTGVSVTRVGNQIILNMPSDVTFASDQDQLNPVFYPTMNAVALVLKKYDRTIIDVYGHTDSTGDDNYNFNLSQRRALSVANYLNMQGVDSRRFAVTGFGETRPVGNNATAQGRAQNRRVEIQLSPLT